MTSSRSAAEKGPKKGHPPKIDIWNLKSAFNGSTFQLNSSLVKEALNYDLHSTIQLIQKERWDLPKDHPLHPSTIKPETGKTPPFTYFGINFYLDLKQDEPLKLNYEDFLFNRVSLDLSDSQKQDLSDLLIVPTRQDAFDHAAIIRYTVAHSLFPLDFREKILHTTKNSHSNLEHIIQHYAKSESFRYSTPPPPVNIPHPIAPAEKDLVKEEPMEIPTETRKTVVEALPHEKMLDAGSFKIGNEGKEFYLDLSGQRYTITGLSFLIEDSYREDFYNNLQGRVHAYSPDIPKNVEDLNFLIWVEGPPNSSLVTISNDFINNGKMITPKEPVEVLDEKSSSSGYYKLAAADRNLNLIMYGNGDQKILKIKKVTDHLVTLSTDRTCFMVDYFLNKIKEME